MSRFHWGRSTRWMRLQEIERGDRECRAKTLSFLLKAKPIVGGWAAISVYTNSCSVILPFWPRQCPYIASTAHAILIAWMKLPPSSNRNITRSAWPLDWNRSRTRILRGLPTMTDNTLISRRDGWIAAWVDENLIMMHAESKFYLNLTGSGGRIWELLESPRSVSDLCKTLGREFEIDPEAARSEVLAFLDQLLLRKAVDVHSSVLA